MLRPFAATIAVALAIVLAMAADAAQAQVVQLPTFEMFGIGTTVSVPTGGSTILGGISRSGSSRVGGGVPGLGRLPGVGRPFGNRGTASTLSAGGARVTATIHDFEGMDQMLLSRAAAMRGSRHSARRMLAQDQTDRSSRRPVLGSSTAERPALGLAEIRRQRLVDQRAKLSEAYGLLDKASTARSQGKYAVAKMYYRMAAKKTDDAELHERIADLMATVSSDQRRAPLLDSPGP